MKKSKIILSLILVIALATAAFAGCASKEKDAGASGDSTSAAAFNYSEGIADNGFWKNITALDNVKLCDYKGISVPGDIHEVPEESIQAEVDNILAENSSSVQIKDRAIVDGDTVNIDYVGSVGGVAFEGGSTDGSGTEVTIGVTSYIDDFLEQLIGHTPGESFNIEVTFPEDYGKEELNGKDAVFATTVNYIVEKVAPELTDDFVAKNLSSAYGWNTVAEMKADIKSNMQSNYVIEYIQEQIVENTTVTSVPKNLLEYQKNSLLSYFQGNADQYSMKLEEFLTTYVGVSTTEELLEKYNEDNTKNAEFSLIIQAIAEDAGISVTDDDVAAYFKEYMGTEDYSTYKETYGMPFLKLTVLNQAVLDYLADNAALE